MILFENKIKSNLSGVSFSDSQDDSTFGGDLLEVRTSQGQTAFVQLGLLQQDGLDLGRVMTALS
jgi:hypothetical protein